LVATLFGGSPILWQPYFVAPLFGVLDYNLSITTFGYMMR
jgi:hypothetical protein